MKYVITALVLVTLSNSSFAIQNCDQHSQNVADDKCAKAGSLLPAKNCTVHDGGILYFECTLSSGLIVNMTAIKSQVPNAIKPQVPNAKKVP